MPSQRAYNLDRADDLHFLQAWKQGLLPVVGATVFEAERPSLVPYAGPFDGFHARTASVSKTCLVQFDRNKYSVMSQAVGRPVEVQAYADRIRVRQDVRPLQDKVGIRAPASQIRDHAN